MTAAMASTEEEQQQKQLQEKRQQLLQEQQQQQLQEQAQAQANRSQTPQKQQQQNQQQQQQKPLAQQQTQNSYSQQQQQQSQHDDQQHSQRQSPDHHTQQQQQQQQQLPPQTFSQQPRPESNGGSSSPSSQKLPETNGSPSLPSGESQIPALIHVKQEPVDDPRDCYTPTNAAVNAALAEAMGMKFSMPRHRYTSLKPSVSPDPSVCEVCQAEFPSSQLLQPHKLCHFNTCHVCYVCDTYFSNAETMTFHMATIHRNLNPTGQALNDDGREWFVCQVCLQRFATNTGLSKHQTSHVALETNYSCRVCGLDFVGSRALMAHLSSSRHTEMKVKMQGVFVCVDCRSIFASRDAYAMHMMLRAQNESCSPTEQIPRSVQSPAKVDNSLQESSSETAASGTSSKPPSRSGSVLTGSRNCSPLNLTTSTPGSTPTHQHSSFVKPAYTCAKCLATFPNQDALAVHLVMHSAMEKSQEMRMSGWGASRPNSAPVSVMHPNKTHSPWMCGRCLVAFDTCDTLAMHMMTKHANESDPERPLSTGHPQLSHSPNNTSQSHMISGTVRNEELMAKIASLQNGQLNMFGKRQRRQSIQSVESDPGAKRSKSSDDTPSSSWFECPSCKQMFNVRMDWYKHVVLCSRQQQQQHQSTPAYKCSVCNAGVADGQALSEHYKTHHPHERQSPKYVCSVCPYVASDSQGLSVHMEQQHGTGIDRVEKVSSSGHQHQTEPSSEGAICDAEDSTSSNGEPTQHREPLNLVCGDRDMEAEMVAKGSTSPEPSVALQQLIDRCDPERSTTPKALPGSTTSGTSGVGSSAEDSSEGDIIDYVLTHAKDLAMCKYCKIVYTDKTLFCLHMGLHNLNNPWQCNMCGRVCQDIHEFTSHVIHF